MTEDEAKLLAKKVKGKLVHHHATATGVSVQIRASKPEDVFKLAEAQFKVSRATMMVDENDHLIASLTIEV